MEEITEADRLAYDGAKLVLLDGRKVQLHYGYGGLRKIEKHFGGVKGLLEKLQEPLGDGFFDAVFFGILYGLWKLGTTEEELEGLIDPTELDKHGEVVANAIIKAFPQKAQEVVEAEAQKAEATTVSPGPTATTTPRSRSGEVTNSSGI